MQTLVLNRNFQPITTVKWTRAVKLWLKDKAQIVDEYEDQYFHTFQDAFNMPAVIRLLHFVRPPRKISRYWPYNRKNIWLRDGGKCQYCGTTIIKKEMTLDHVIPRNLGGKSRWDNICCACFGCNSRKANRTPEQAGMELLRKPFFPRLKGREAREIVLGIRGLKYVPHRSWCNYIYWNVELKE